MPNEPRRELTRSAEQLIADFLSVPRDGSRSRRRPAQSVSNLVEEILQKHQIGRDAPEHTIREHWAEVVGPANAHYSHAAQIDRNRLIVLASHSVVRNELFHHRATIVANIRKLPGCSHVREINVRAG